MEAHGFADADKARALLKFAVQMHGAVDIFDRNFISAAADGDIALDMLGVGGACFQIQDGVSSVIVEGDVAIVIGDLNRSVHAIDGDAATPGDDDQVGVTGHVNIQVQRHAVVARSLSVGVQGQDFVFGCNGGSCPGVIGVCVGLMLGANLLAPGDLELVVVGDVDGDGSVIVVDVERGVVRTVGTGGPVVGEIAAVVVGGSAKDVVEVFVVAQLH